LAYNFMEEGRTFGSGELPDVFIRKILGVERKE
jgi:hypothetical protein